MKKKIFLIFLIFCTTVFSQRKEAATGIHMRNNLYYFEQEKEPYTGILESENYIGDELKFEVIKGKLIKADTYFKNGEKKIETYFINHRLSLGIKSYINEFEEFAGTKYLEIFGYTNGDVEEGYIFRIEKKVSSFGEFYNNFISIPFKYFINLKKDKENSSNAVVPNPIWLKEYKNNSEENPYSQGTFIKIKIDDKIYNGCVNPNLLDALVYTNQYYEKYKQNLDELPIFFEFYIVNDDQEFDRDLNSEFITDLQKGNILKVSFPNKNFSHYVFSYNLKNSGIAFKEIDKYPVRTK